MVATSALNGHFGIPALPDTVVGLIAAYHRLCADLSRRICSKDSADLDKTNAWIADLLSSRNMRKRLDVDRRDVVGRIAREAAYSFRWFRR